MSSLDRHPEIVRLARSLGMDDGAGAMRAIIVDCREKLARWMEESGSVRSIRQLQDLVCGRLNLVMEVVRSEAELRAVVGRYVAEGEVVFASLPALFDEETFATLIRRRQGGGEPGYVAVIDGRGRKGSRVFFSCWHEIAHMLTLGGKLMEQPVHRSTSRLSPVERLMDAIAAEIAFNDRLFAPVLESELGPERLLTFDLVERVRSRYEPEASFQATLLACLRRLDRPALYLEAGLGWTRAEEEQFDREPIPARRPKPKLRVQKAVQNEAARRISFYIPPHMAVPASSVLSGVFFGGQVLGRRGEALAHELLEQWQHSDGSALGPGRVRVQARVTDERVLGLLFPLDFVGEAS